MKKWLKQLWMTLRPVESSNVGKKVENSHAGKVVTTAKEEIKMTVTDSAIEPFTPWYTYGDHMYRSAKEIAEVLFTNPETGEQRLIVDNGGYIMNFPGIVKEDFWTKEITHARNLDPVIRFRTEFSKYDDERYIMLWQVQPEGRYWADSDGFGWEPDAEILLYAFIDKNGNFMGPFRIYRIDNKKYL